MSGVILLLQTSNGEPVMGLTRGEDVLFDSATRPDLAGSRDYRKMLESGFAETGLSLTDLSAIYVDIGPGGLGVTRTGVAFANGLGFALGLPVTGLPAFELIGTEVERDKPVVILRRAARPFVHFGVFENGVLRDYAHIDESDADARISALGTPFDFAGNVPREGLATPLTNRASVDAMRKLALTKEVRDDSRAFPIVEVLE